MIKNSSTDQHSNGPPVHLPARMVNEVTYCPRLFYYEYVEGIFVHNQETIEGAINHKRVDKKEDELPSPDELAECETKVTSRSVTLASDEHGVLAKIDLVEASDGQVTPVDYKRGAPKKNEDGTLTAWDAELVQMGVQALVLRANDYACHEAIIYFAKTRQRVRIPVDEKLIAMTLESIALARQIMASEQIPPPLVDSPKCPRCSLVAICLPDETRSCSSSQLNHSRPAVYQKTLFEIPSQPSASLGISAHKDTEIRRLVTARDEKKPLYVNTPGLAIGKSGEVLSIKEKTKVIQKVRIHEICQLNLMGPIQVTTQAIQTLCELEIPIAYFSGGGWFYGITQGLGVKNIFLRQSQFRLADRPSFCLKLARALVAGKIRNQRTLLQRNHVEPPARTLALMKCLQDDAMQSPSLEVLLGLEGNAARMYFQSFSGMIKVVEDNGRIAMVEFESKAPPSRATSSSMQSPEMKFDFNSRNRRPPRDPVNALLSLAYSVLAKDLTIIAQSVGLDPYLGFYHQPRFGRASLALDLMEPFRPLIAESAVLTAINNRMVTPNDFVRAGDSVALSTSGRKNFFRAYEQRMDQLVTHPLFGYRVNYRRMLEIQTRLLARVLEGELHDYPVFVTR